MGAGSGSDTDADGWGAPDTDGDLLIAARRAPECFGQFYDRNFDAIIGFFYRRTASADVAADLAAETFTAALGGLHRFHRHRGTGRSWLMGIAANLYREWLRKGHAETKARRRLDVATPRADRSDLERIEATIDLQPLLDALPQAVDALSPAVRDALLLRIAEQLPYAEVARRLGCTEVSARVRVSRGLDRLHQHLAVT